ncbi:hypothetical protein DL765_009996 [Monosporascus sp. GIB2]|nr:hypothetical protein DL765_009996 [Monosporascus sp. GIB2]
MIRLKSMYEGEWPIKNQPRLSLKLGGFEDDTIIDTEEAAIIEPSQDTLALKPGPLKVPQTAGPWIGSESITASLRRPKVRGLAVVKIKVQDADVYAKGYSSCRVAKEVEGDHQRDWDCTYPWC